MSEEQKPNNNKKVPSLPKVSAPKVEIREEMKANIDHFVDELVPVMSTHEIQYLLQKLGLAPARQQGEQTRERKALALNLPMPTKQKVIQPVEPLRELDEALEMAEKKVTRGFIEPQMIVPLQQNEENPVLDMIVQRVDKFLDKLTEDPENARKISASISRLLEALATKIEEAGKHG
ncbi:MAG: hypothetical protein ACPL1Z_05830 [Candidatus Bathyarchaeales archaeon]